ncbi:hypothetical protein GCM10028789_05270 [Sinomonas halotolerans]
MGDARHTARWTVRPKLEADAVQNVLREASGPRTSRAQREPEVRGHVGVVEVDAQELSRAADPMPH